MVFIVQFYDILTLSMDNAILKITDNNDVIHDIMTSTFSRILRRIQNGEVSSLSWQNHFVCTYKIS
jgi:hypothetical protein